MATATKWAMATNGNTTGSGYQCLPLSAVAAAVVGKDHKGGGGLFLYGVVVKKIGLCVFSILMFGKEAVCPDGLFVPAVFQELGFYFNSLIFSSCVIESVFWLWRNIVFGVTYLPVVPLCQCFGCGGK
jgi:hypothetical protein